MKYLKTHEEYNYHFKKYIIWKKYNSFVIFEILTPLNITSHEQQLTLIRLELYYQNNGKIENRNIDDIDRNIYYKSAKSTMDNLIYQSDRLEDCLEYMKYKTDITKYNL